MFEEWRSLGHGDGYEVSSHGRVRHAATGELKEPTTTPKGELVINLKLGGVWSVRLVRALVADCFLGPKPPHCMIVHKDGDRTHCAAMNLAFVERRFPRPSGCDEQDKCKANRLTDSQVRDIKRRLKRGETGRALALEFGVSAPHVSLIRRGKKWKSIK